MDSTRSRLTLLTVALATFMTYLDNNIVNVAIPAIQRSLHLNTAGLEWVVSGYILVFASLLLAGGRLADRVHKPAAYAASCALGLVACVVMAWSPRTDAGYAVSTLLYSFSLGMVAASFTGLVLSIVGHSAAATKINLFFALNTLFSFGMLRVDGWAHDAWATNGMLYTEAATGVVALAVFGWLVGRVPGAVMPASEPPHD